MLVLVGCAAFASPALALDPTFSDGPGSPVTLTSSGRAVAGDFNGDGRIDLAVTAPITDKVSQLLATDGAGAFGARTEIDVGDAPDFVAVVDLNADGRDDVAVANSGSDNVSVLLGSAAGLTSPATFAVGDVPEGIVAADLTGDGKLDLAVANSGTGTGANTVSLLAGDGAGGFAAASPQAVGCTAASATTTPYDLKAGDLTGDGKPDLAVTCQSNGVVRVLVNTGLGAFTSQAGSAPGGNTNTAVELADFNNDGKLDILANHFSPGEFHLALGAGAGVFTPTTGANQFPTGPGTPPGTFRPAATSADVVLDLEPRDVNGDDKVDVVVPDWSNQILVAQGDGAGGFGPPQVGNTVGTVVATTTDDAFSATTADLNGDGRPDIASTIADFHLRILLNDTPIPGVATGGASEAGSRSATVAASVDANGSPTTYRFEYGPTSAYGSSTPPLPEGGTITGTSPVPVSGGLSGLAPSTTYHYRVVGNNGNGHTYGLDRAFTTTAAPTAGSAAPVNTSAPRVSGRAQNGSTLSCAPGGWSGNPSFAYRWQRNGAAIAGAVTSRYKVAKSDVGTALECRVTGTNAGGSSAAESAPLVVTAAPCVVPKLKGLTLKQAKGRLSKANCRSGKVGKARSRRVKKGRVIASKPKAGKRAAAGTKVALTLSRGR
jgi:hypothetical protein